MEMELLANEARRMRFAPERKGWLYSMPISSMAWSEPVKEEFIEIKDESHRTYVLRRWRNRIDEPLQYEVFPGLIETRLLDIEVLEKEIKSSLEQEKILTGDEVNRFVAVIRSAFNNFKGRIERCLADDNLTDLAESSHPLVAFFTLRSDFYIMRAIKYTVAKVWPGKKQEINRFIEKYRDELMTVKIVRDFKVLRAE